MEPSGQVYLCKNSVLDRTYNHTIDFKSPEEQLSYWGSLVKYRLTEFTYIRKQRQYIRVDKSLDELQDINYLFYRAKEDSKYYFCFVTDKEYYANNTTYVYYDIDVLQSYLFDYEVKESYVVQEHVDRWTPDKKPIYSRTDEGLAYGDEYTLESAYQVRNTLDDSFNNHYNDGIDHNVRFYLALLKNHKSRDSNELEPSDTPPSFIPTTANPYIILLIPSEGLRDTNYRLYPGGTNIPISNITSFMHLMATTELGNLVHGVYKLNYLPFNKELFVFKDNELCILNYVNSGDDLGPFFPHYFEYNNTTCFIRINSMYLKSSGLAQELASMGVFDGLESAVPTAEQWAEVKAKPRTTKRDKRWESKLLTHPYRYNLLTDWKNNPVVIKNEYLAGDKITIKFTQSIEFMGGARYWVDNYRKDVEGRANSLVQLMSENLPIITDAYYSYMLANRNQLEATKQTAILNSVANTGKAIVGGAVAGATVGGVVGAIGGAVVGGTSSIYDGIVNYTNLIRQQNALQKDLKNTPDTILSSNDASFNVYDRNEYITFYRYKICCEFEEMLADAFNLTGYTVKRVKKPNTKSRVRFNYVRTAGANIVGSFSQEDLLKIRQIYDNGVTFWHYSEQDFKPLDYSYENIETSLL